jgi:hypothetical protein
VSKARGAATIHAMRAQVVREMGLGRDAPDREWCQGVIDALQWVLKEGGGPVLAAMEARLPTRTDVMNRGKFEQFLGFSLPDDEWDDLQRRGVESGKWLPPEED